MKDAVEELNGLLEAYKKKRKDEGKRRDDGTPVVSPALMCIEPGCLFAGQTKAGLVNHIRQRHGSVAQL